MAENKDIIRTGMYLPAELVRRCELAMATIGCKSRSEFIRNALEHYIAVLNAKSNSKVLTPALESVIGGRISMTEDRLSHILFKLGVEVAMMNNILAATHDISDDSMEGLRQYCTNAVAATGGKYSFEDALGFQKGDG